jgi:hypothetical protein
MRMLVVLCAIALPVAADEGLWLFNQFPKDAVKTKYSVEVSDQFLENLRLASLQIGTGSGAFVSPEGLILTNQRLVRDCIGTHSKEAFLAGARSAELSCPGLDAKVLMAIEDVTKQMKETGPGAAKAVSLEKACAQKTGNVCAVVKLYAGERYDLYQYRRYADLRLVFAPEFDIAFFGGEPDNFTYPRYALDIAFLRAYENGKPASTPHFLKWSAEGVKENEPVFTAGSPGPTSRLASQAQFAFYRTVQLPIVLARLMSRIEALRAYSAKSAENQRAAEAVLVSLSDTYKSSAGKLLGLKDDRLSLRKQQFEKRLRRAVESDPKLGTEAAKVWDDVAAAYKNWTPSEKAYEVLECPAALGSTLFAVARGLVRQHPVDAAGRINEGVEIALITQYFEQFKTLGDKEAPVKAVLAGRTPEQAAEAYVKGSKLADPTERKRLAADHDAVTKSTDSMIKLAQMLDGPALKLRRRYEDTIEKLDASALERIAQYRFRVLGPNESPEPASTPRVSFGTVNAYRDKTEAPAPFATTFGGLYHRAGKEAPYLLPQRWVDAKKSLDLVTPFDFVTTCDIGSGTAGAATVNTKGEIVGIVFDGNIESLTLTYLYSDEQARAVHVAVQGIVEALRTVYGAGALLRELGVAPPTI